MSADDPLAVAISDWQHKHRIADGDPMIAALELVRIYLRHAREVDDKAAAPRRTSRTSAAPSSCSTAARNHSSSKQLTSLASCAGSGNPLNALIEAAS
jgi:hypothetical protein